MVLAERSPRILEIRNLICDVEVSPCVIKIKIGLFRAQTVIKMLGGLLAKKVEACVFSPFPKYDRRIIIMTFQSYSCKISCYYWTYPKTNSM